MQLSYTDLRAAETRPFLVLLQAMREGHRASRSAQTDTDRYMIWRLNTLSAPAETIRPMKRRISVRPPLASRGLPALAPLCCCPDGPSSPRRPALALPGQTCRLSAVRLCILLQKPGCLTYGCSRTLRHLCINCEIQAVHTQNHS